MVARLEDDGMCTQDQVEDRHHMELFRGGTTVASESDNGCGRCIGTAYIIGEI